MNNHDWDQLQKMHNQINQTGVSAFDTAYLEKYTELFAKSLEGKANPMDGYTAPGSRPNHTMV